MGEWRYWLNERRFDPRVGGGVDREKIPARDFAGKNRSFPIVTPQDVDDAAQSIGRAGAENFSTEQLKKNIIRIAKRKGPAFVAKLPKSWKEELGMEESSLSEAGNVGDWLESRIHSAFVDIVNGMFGDGRLTREERVTLFEAIDTAMDAFNESLQGAAEHLFQRSPWTHPGMGGAPLVEDARQSEEGDEPGLVDLEEASLVGDCMPLLEAAVRSDGTVPVKIIEPGWGASGFYSPELLERDGPRVFRKGIQMFWDHPTPQEEAARPERSLRDLAAELVSDARWDASGSSGPGLYADAQVFEPFREAVDELAPYIGVSIRAIGRARQGKAEGKEGPIIEQIASAKSVDFVTTPGAGGRILQLFEAVRPQAGGAGTRLQRGTEENMADEKDAKQLREANEQQAAEIKRLQDALLLWEAGDHVTEVLKETAMPESVRMRLIAAMTVQPPVKDGKLDREAHKGQIVEAAKQELEYLAKVTGSGQIRGMGGGQDSSPEKMQAELEGSFRRMGMSESAAKVAAAGRG